MPLYDYKCKKCGHIFEVQQKMTDEPLKGCPRCKGEIYRLISAAGIVFKGSGFHVTDYKKQGKEKPKADSSKPKSEDKQKAKETKSSPKASSPNPSK